MDARRNPYAPGAGTPPPELAGRDDIIERAAIALDRIRAGRAARSVVLYGLRGVGKTVLLQRIRTNAEHQGFVSVSIEAPEERSLPSLLAPALRSTLIGLSRGEAARSMLKKAFGALASFARAAKVKYDDVEFNIDFEKQAGLADSGDFEHDLRDLLVSVGEMAAERDTAVVLFMDELQYIPENQLAPLIGALHVANQKQLPITLVAAGLPQLLGQMGRAKSYAERLFEFVPIGPLDAEAARRALRVPAQNEGADYEEGGITEIISRTERYPLLPAGMGQACLGSGRNLPDHQGRRDACDGGCACRTGRQLLPRSLRPPDPGGKTLHARHGRTRGRAASFGRHRGKTWKENLGCRSGTQPVDSEGDGVQPFAWRHHVHGAAV